MESFDTLTSAEVSAVLKATPSTIDPDTDAIISRTQDYYNKEHIFQFYIQVINSWDIGCSQKTLSRGLTLGPTYST